MTLGNWNGYCNISGSPVFRTVMCKMRFELGYKRVSSQMKNPT